MANSRILLQEPPVRTAAELAARYAHLALQPLEVLVIVAMDKGGAVRGETFVRGQVGHVAVRPAQVLQPVVVLGAAAFALVHNHPSGRSQPSAADVAFTSRVAAAAQLLGVALVDHVIVASRGWTSLASSGLLPRRGS